MTETEAKCLSALLKGLFNQDWKPFTNDTMPLGVFRMHCKEKHSYLSNLESVCKYIKYWAEPDLTTESDTVIPSKGK